VNASRWMRLRDDGSLEPQAARVSDAPWKASPPEKDGRIYVHAADCTIVCVVESDWPDARLIERAPEVERMLRALVEERHAHVDPLDDDEAPDGTVAALYAKARALLSTAR
jgi:hypothetical protein